MKNQIELSHIGLVFLTEFVRKNKHVFEKNKENRIKFLKMNAAQRIKLIDDTIDSITLTK